jgi:hypothetical protein
MKRLLIPALAVGAIVAGTSQAQAINLTPPPITLDTFNTGTFIIDKSAGKTTGRFIGTQSGSGILGGERDVAFTISKHTIPERSAIAQVTDGDFLLDLGPGVKTTALITWNGADVINNKGKLVPVGLNTNLTQGGLDTFKLGIELIDQFANLTFTVTDRKKQVSTLTKTGLQAGNQFFEFKDFIGNADFKDVYAVKLFIDTPMSADLQLNFLQSAKKVPEPLTILGSIAALGFGAAFRRKYQKKA